MTSQYDYELMWHHLRPKAKATITVKKNILDDFSVSYGIDESND